MNIRCEYITETDERLPAILLSFIVVSNVAFAMIVATTGRVLQVPVDLIRVPVVTE